MIDLETTPGPNLQIKNHRDTMKIQRLNSELEKQIAERTLELRLQNKMIIERSGYDEGRANNAPALMVLTNASGKTLMQSRLVNLVQSVDVSRLPAGVYFVTIINGNNKTTNKMIITR